MPNHGLSQRLEVLRQSRRAPDAPPGIGAMFQAQAKQLRRLERSLAGIGGAWTELCPPALLERTCIVSLRRGVLTIGVSDSAVLYEVDRLLRTGAQRQLVRSCPSTLRKVKVVLRSDLAGESER